MIIRIVGAVVLGVIGSIVYKFDEPIGIYFLCCSANCMWSVDKPAGVTK